MAIRKLRVGEILAINYFVLHDLVGVHPTIAEGDRGAFQLKGLQFAKLIKNSNFPHVVAARTLAKFYADSYYAMPDVSSKFVSPGEETMQDLAMHMKNSQLVLPAPQGVEEILKG